MDYTKNYDVIIIGGSYAGLAAALALGRGLKDVLIIDNRFPANSQTPYSHNFLTQDGNTPSGIAKTAREQVAKYDTVDFCEGEALEVEKKRDLFQVTVSSDRYFKARKIIFATGIKDILPQIPGFAECWGVSVLHCPYCHGYEVKNCPTTILINNSDGFEFAALISNWTNELTVLTHGVSYLTQEQIATLQKKHIGIIEKSIQNLDHINGKLKRINFTDGTTFFTDALYARVPFIQHCSIPEKFGCEMNEGYIKTDLTQMTSIQGIYACGDNTSRMRTVANAVATGTATGMMVNKEIIIEDFMI